MPDKSVKELSKLLMEKAKKTLSYIPSYIELGDYNTAINRSYYSAFYSMKAIEILDGFDSKKHSGVVAYFRSQYIKTGILDKELSRIIGRLLDSREQGDYNLTVEFDLQDATELFSYAKKFVNEIDQYLKLNDED